MSHTKATVLQPLSVNTNAIGSPRLMMNNVQPASATVDAFPELDQDTLSYEPDSPHSSPANIERRWQPRKSSFSSTTRGHTRKRSSMSQTVGKLRTRGASVGRNAQDFAVSLKAPISYKLILLCVLWYLTSALTNTSSKAILNALPKPITLTLVQFGFVSAWCLVLAWLAHIFPSLRHFIPALKNGIRYPTPDVIFVAMPLACFSLTGHILSSMATTTIPVSLVHTIKGLSPLFTVFAYRVFFGIKYARATYMSLVPLTVGVMLACSTGFSTDFFGILCAFSAAVVFVTQNIFSKRLFNEAARTEADSSSTVVSRKLDKLNLLCYCSAIGFVFTAPIWFISEGYTLSADLLHDGSIDLSGNQGSFDHGDLLFELFFNGTSHFAQNILAFVLLSAISPVSYSVASLIKRVFVIVVAIIWFGNRTTTVQASGIFLTFVGLYLYDRYSHDDSADKRANADHFQSRNILPMHSATQMNDDDSEAVPRRSNLMIRSYDRDLKKEDESNMAGVMPSLLPGTRQESTWKFGDKFKHPES